MLPRTLALAAATFACVCAVQSSASAQGAAVIAATDVSPDVLARSITDDVLTIVRVEKESQAGGRSRVLQLVEAKVLPHFNFAYMTQLAMGRNWGKATPEQQKALTDEFRTLLVRTYAIVITLYRDQTIIYRPLRIAAGDTDALVNSVIKQPSGKSIAVDYSMHNLGSAWKVYDVRIDGVSLVANYRNTFNTEVHRSGVDGLIKVLATKNQMPAGRSAK